MMPFTPTALKAGCLVLFSFHKEMSAPSASWSVIVDTIYPAFLWESEQFLLPAESLPVFSGIFLPCYRLWPEALCQNMCVCFKKEQPSRNSCQNTHTQTCVHHTQEVFHTKALERERAVAKTLIAILSHWILITLLPVIAPQLYMCCISALYSFSN